MSALAMVSDSPAASGSRLSGACTKREQIGRLENKRATTKVSQELLARVAGLTDRTYRCVLANPDRAKQSVIDRFDWALARILTMPSRGLIEAVSIKAHYRGFVLALAADYGMTPDEVFAADPRAGATADPHWRACAHVRQAAIYLTNTALGLKQRRLAEVLELTPAAVCLALKAVEDRRDDPDFDAALRRAAKTITGRDDE